jgi:hypothetical protein
MTDGIRDMKGFYTSQIQLALRKSLLTYNFIDTLKEKLPGDMMLYTLQLKT